MILEAVNDTACLGQLVALARELARGSAARRIATELGTPGRVVSWLQSLPQSDDDGRETLQAIQCDVPQRVRLFPSDPNCFERTLAALALCEILDPKTPRCAVTIEKPVRHTSLAELRGGRWEPVDLFPRRNFGTLWRSASASAADVGKDILQGFHRFVGKPLLTAYGLGGLADQIGQAEDQAIGRSRPVASPAPPSSSASPAAASSPPSLKQGEERDETENQRAPEAPRFAFWPTERPSRAG